MQKKLLEVLWDEYKIRSGIVAVEPFHRTPKPRHRQFFHPTSHHDPGPLRCSTLESPDLASPSIPSVVRLEPILSPASCGLVSANRGTDARNCQWMDLSPPLKHRLTGATVDFQLRHAKTRVEDKTAGRETDENGDLGTSVGK